MHELKKMERYLRVDLLGPGPRLMKKNNLPGRGLTKVEKHCSQKLKCDRHFSSAMRFSCPVHCKSISRTLQIIKFFFFILTLIVLMWRIGLAHNNARK